MFPYRQLLLLAHANACMDPGGSYRQLGGGETAVGGNNGNRRRDRVFYADGATAAKAYNRWGIGIGSGRRSMGLLCGRCCVVGGLVDYAGGWKFFANISQAF